MDGTAIKVAAAKVGRNEEPTDEETAAAVAEGIEIVLSIANSLERIANAAERQTT